jgi:hypothetical protein
VSRFGCSNAAGSCGWNPESYGGSGASLRLQNRGIDGLAFKDLEIGADDHAVPHQIGFLDGLIIDRNGVGTLQIFISL